MDPNTSAPAPQKNNTMMFVIGIVVLLLVGAGIVFAMNRGNSSPEQAAQEATQPNAAMEPQETSEQTMEPTGAMTEGETAGAVKEFTVSGKNFSFAPNVIRVKKGDTVRVNFENTGGLHDFVIDELDVATAQIQGGQSEVVEFVADTAGTFDFYCSVGQHRANGMEGQLIVE